MSYLGVGNRILPQEWKDFRGKEKWGIRTHQKCWGAVRAFFGTAIKWELGKENFVYINTRSVKHWWKSNHKWRESIGFGGDFSRKKLKELLQYKPKIQTTSSEIKAAVQTPIEVKPLERSSPPPTIPEKPPAVHPPANKLVESLQKLCDECEEFLRGFKEVLNSETYEALLKDVDLYEWKQWLKQGDAPELQACIEAMPRVKNSLEEALQKALKREIKTLKEETEQDTLNKTLRITTFRDEGNFREYMYKVIQFKEMDKFLTQNSLTLPTYKLYDSETEKLAQHRWVLLYIRDKMDFDGYIKKEKEKEPLDEKLLQALEKEDIEGAISHCKTLRQEDDKYLDRKYEQIGEALTRLQEELKTIPGMDQVNLEEAQEKLGKRHLELLRFSLKYDRFKIGTIRNELSKLFSHVLNPDELFKNMNWYNFTEGSWKFDSIFINLAQHLPQKFIANIRLKFVLGPLLNSNTYEEMLLKGLKEAWKTRHDELSSDIQNLRVEINSRLELCSEEEKKAVQELLESLDGIDKSENPRETLETLKGQYPNHFVEFQEVDSTIDPEIAKFYYSHEIQKIVLKRLNEAKLSLDESVKKETKNLIEKCRAFDHFVFNENTFMDDFKEWYPLGHKHTQFKYDFKEYLSEKEKEALSFSEKGKKRFDDYRTLHNMVDQYDLFDREKEDLEKLKTSCDKWLRELRSESIFQSVRLKKAAKDNNEALEGLKKTIEDISKFASKELDWESLSKSLEFFGALIRLENDRRDLPEYPKESPEGKFIQKIKRADAIENLRVAIAPKNSVQKSLPEALERRKELARKVLEAKKPPQKVKKISFDIPEDGP